MRHLRKVSASSKRPDAAPKEFIAKAKAAGAVVVHKCTSVRHALSAERAGVDAISIDGFEERRAIQAKMTWVALCCFRPPRGRPGPHSRLRWDRLGARHGGGPDAWCRGRQHGNPVLRNQEAPIHDNIKRALLATNERDTNLIFRTLRNTGRVLEPGVGRSRADREPSRRM